MNPTPKPILVEMTVDLTLRGPVLTKSAVAGPWGIDIVCARDGRGRLFLPGPLVKGKVREAFDESYTGADPFTDSQGCRRSRSADMLADTSSGSAPVREPPERYPAVFYDFIAAGPWPGPGTQTITRVRINEATGSADSGGLWVIDCPVLPGQEVTFRGAIRFGAPSRDDISPIVEAISDRMEWVHGYGADQATGSGKTVSARIRRFWIRDLRESARVDSYSPERFATAAAAAPRLAIVDWELLDPFCVPSGLINGNVFESEDHLRGDVLKGAIAESLRQIVGLPPGGDLKQGDGEKLPFANLRRHFSAVRITTARPWFSTMPGSPTIPPHSLGIVGRTVYDFVLAGLGQANDFAPLVHGRAAKFFPDWKLADSELVRGQFHSPNLVRELRVRTAIDSKSRRAKEEQLFSYRLIRPEGLVWRGLVGVVPDSRLDETTSQNVLNELEDFLELGWIHIGKTKARAADGSSKPWCPKEFTARVGMASTGPSRS